MDFSFTDEQEALRTTLRDLFTRRATSADVRRAMGTPAGHDADLWKLCCEQLGLPGLAVAEEHGGSGASWVELAIAFEEAGRALLPVPLLSCAVTAEVVAAAGDDQAAADLLPGLASGTAVGAVAVAESHSWDPAAIRSDAQRSTEGWVLTGRKQHVVDGQLADLFLVAARADGRPAVFVVDSDAPGLRRTPLATVDQARRQTTLDLHDTPGRLLGDVDRGAALLSHAVDLWSLALAVEAVGAARRCLELTLEHLRTRVQFGRPIGSFQALKHRAADLAVEVESAASTAYYAAWAGAAAPDELPVVAPLAKGYCTEVFSHVAAEMVQLHGGIGFTWEHDAHLYFKRAHGSAALFGAPREQRRLVAQRAGLTTVSASAPSGS